MGRKRNSHRPSEPRDLRHRDQAAFPANDRHAVPQGRVRPDAGFPLRECGEAQDGYPLAAVCAFLLLAVALVFGQTVRHEFINFDDDKFLYENPHIAPGLTGNGISWAFTRFEGHYWIPLTRISSMLDCQLYGLKAGGHHLTNVLLHATTAVLLFLVLRRMTGGFWPSALAAALFAVHPLHVESVAWVTERKDMLSGLFFVLTLGAYGWYVRRPFTPGRYLLLVAVFLMGLMAKPMLVTLPLVLLLLDYWPLGRMTSTATADISVAGNERQGRFSFPLRCVLEKLPLLLLVALFCGVTYWTMSEVVANKEDLSFSWRIGNALVSYVAYLGQLICPLGLAPFYPHPGANLPVWKVIGAGVVLASISAGVLAYRRRYPCLLVGWLWYAGMLVPVIGLVQLGAAAMADRFTYLPQIGLCIALAWGAAEVCRSRPYRRLVCGVVSALVLAVLMGCAWRQTCFWRDSETLWTHTLSCTSQNVLAYCKFGVTLVDQGQTEKGITEYRKALAINPDSARAHNMLGEALQRLGKTAEAIEQYQVAAELEPDDADVHYNLGEILRQQGRLAEALEQFKRSLDLNPNRSDAYTNFGAALGELGRPAEAIEQFEKALEIDPARAEAHNDLGVTLAGLGRVDEAIEHYLAALKHKPDYAMAHNNLGVALATRGRLDEAIEQYREALKAKPDYGRARYNLDEALRRKAGTAP